MSNVVKKSILIVIDALDCGGAEKSLINLLSLIDYTRYDVDLLLFSRGGINEEFVPEQVNILPEAAPSPGNGLLRRADYAIRKVIFSVSMRITPKIVPNDYTVRLWRLLGKYFSPLDKRYDIAIAYAQRMPTLFVADKVKAATKFSWMNVTVSHPKYIMDFFTPFFRKFDNIVCVSDDVLTTFNEHYPEFKDKSSVIYDIISHEFVKKLSLRDCRIEQRKDEIVILTAARLDCGQKGYDILIKVCRVLKDKGLNFKWYALGNGEKEEVERLIAENYVADRLILLGAVPNPYPYFVNADIYVQTSRFEGYGLSIAEARMLNLPVVTTPYDCVGLQIKNGINGLISTDFTPESVAGAILRLVGDKELYDSIVENLKKEKKGNVEEFYKFRRIVLREN